MLFYGKIKGSSVDFEKADENEWMMFMAANQGRKIWVEAGFETRQRTVPQNSALHLGLQMIADTLNDAGLEMKAVLSNRMNVPWTGEMVKELLYRPLMKAKLGKKSTTELTKDEVSEIYDLLQRELGEQYGVEYIPFPSKLTKNETLTAS